MTIRQWRPAAGILVILAGVGLVGGCAGTTGSSGGESSDAPTSTSYYSPLEEYLSPPDGGVMPTSQEEWQAKEREVQDLIAPCMAAQGFEYVPFVYSGTDEGMATDADLDQRAWTEKYGYGISTFDTPGGSPGTDSDDPNTAIVEAMSEGERTAYFEALWGAPMGLDMTPSPPDSDPTETTGSEATGSEATGSETTGSETTGSEPTGTGTIGSEGPGPSADALDSATDLSSRADPATGMPALQDQGCWGKAQAEVFGEGYLGGGTDQFQDMWEALSRMSEEVTQDERLTRATTDWVGCMSDAGHPGFSAVQDPLDELNRTWSELNGWPPPDSDMTQTPLELTAEPTTPAPEAVSKFQSDEIAVALADFDCRAKVGYDELFDAARIDAETQFVQEHRAELEQYRDVINGGG